MLRLSVALFKKQVVPLGFSKRQFARKRNTPGSRKPWRGMNRVADGTIDVERQNENNYDGEEEDDMRRGGELMDVGMPTFRSELLANASEALQRTTSNREIDTLSETLSDDVLSHLSPQAIPPVFAPTNSSARADELDDRSGGGGSAINAHFDRSPSTSLPIGDSLRLRVADTEAYAARESGETSSSLSSSSDSVPLALQHLKRTRKQAAESVVLPRHLNQLFHKIMGWSNEAVEVESNPASPLAPATISDDQMAADPSLPQKRYSATGDKVRYGLLLEDYEKDKFAVEHRLTIAGNRFEKKFVEWEGMKLLDTDAAAAMEQTRASKGSLIIDSPLHSKFRVPIVNRDPCPGCGATLQDKDDASFGYVRRGQVEEYIQKESEVVKLKSEYADRMAELQQHWETHGRKVGEEWLDFMTQDEFNAIYRHTTRPFVCHRCHALENLGVEGRKKVMSAPDFTEQLRALKEKRCLVVLVVDVTDFPGSMVYDLPGLISMNNEVIIAVNKCDCIRMRRFSYDGRNVQISKRMSTEAYIRSWVTNIATDFGLPKHRIVDVVPISAKRGWNIDRLLASIEAASNLNLRHNFKPLKTYFVGVANVGKSSVINAIAHHLYVPVPPHPESTKVYYSRTGKDGKETVHWRWYTPPNVHRAEMTDIPSRHDKKASKLVTVSSLPGTTVAANAVRIALHAGSGAGADASTYFFDTPGLFPHWHQTSPLTLYQMRKCLIRVYRNPMCYQLLPGQTLFLGGLAALDVVKGPSSGMLLMVYCSSKVKCAVVATDASDMFWAQNLGSRLDPPGSLEECGDARLTVHKSYVFECFGRHRLRPKADIYVCGLGWVAFCVSRPCDVLLRVRTLPGVVHGVREPLRPKDLRGWNRWPKLTNQFKIKKPSPESVDTVVRLVSREVKPDDPPLREVERTERVKHTAAAAEPFADAVSELQSQGKF